jgi:hypothetical protein
VRQSAIGAGAREVAVEPDRLGEVGKRAICLPGSLQRRAALVAQPGVVRIGLDRAVEIREREREFLLGAPRKRARGERARVLRGKPDRGIEIDDGALEIAFLVVRDPTASVGGGEIRVEPDASA